MKEMVGFITKPPIAVDEWDTEVYPIDPRLRIFTHFKNNIVLDIVSIMGINAPEQINCFSMTAKRSYNSDETRDHICRYLNYYEAYYDIGHRLLMYMAKIKYQLEYIPEYSKMDFVNDIRIMLLGDMNIINAADRFVEDNYSMNLSSNNKTPNLQFDNGHAKLLYKISLLMNMYIPLATHFIYIKFTVKDPQKVKDFLRELFSMTVERIKELHGVDIYNKIYEVAESVVNKSKGPDKVLWDKSLIRGINPTTHTMDSVDDIILQIIPKYNYTRNIINFNYFSNRQCLRFRITEIRYEAVFVPLSSSKRDADQNSEYDRYAAHLDKPDESLRIMNKVIAERTVEYIEKIYGGISYGEIEHYRVKLTAGGNSAKNPLQQQLIGYTFYKYFGDPISMESIAGEYAYIKLMIAAKRHLSQSGYVVLPYIISSRISRSATRKLMNISKRDRLKINPDILKTLEVKYAGNQKVIDKIWELAGSILSATYEIIDYNNQEIEGLELGKDISLFEDVIINEVVKFIGSI